MLTWFLHSSCLSCLYTGSTSLTVVSLWPLWSYFPLLLSHTQRSSLSVFSVQFSSVAQSCPTLCDLMDCSTPGFLSITNSRSLLRLMFIESLMPSNHLILCCPLFLLPLIFPSIKVFSNESSSVQFSRSVMSDSLWPHGLQHTRLPCLSPTPELAQTHVHQVSDAIQPSHPLSSSSPPAFNLSRHQGLFRWVSSTHQMAKGLELQL